MSIEQRTENERIEALEKQLQEIAAQNLALMHRVAALEARPVGWYPWPYIPPYPPAASPPVWPNSPWVVTSNPPVVTT